VGGLAFFLFFLIFLLFFFGRFDYVGGVPAGFEDLFEGEIKEKFEDVKVIHKVGFLAIFLFFFDLF